MINWKRANSFKSLPLLIRVYMHGYNTSVGCDDFVSWADRKVKRKILTDSERHREGGGSLTYTSFLEWGRWEGIVRGVRNNNICNEGFKIIASSPKARITITFRYTQLFEIWIIHLAYNTISYIIYYNTCVPDLCSIETECRYFCIFTRARQRQFDHRQELLLLTEFINK